MGGSLSWTHVLQMKHNSKVGRGARKLSNYGYDSISKYTYVLGLGLYRIKNFYFVLIPSPIPKIPKI